MYLEQIGVKPNKLTMEMVHKNVPLTDKAVKATFRAKGHVTDEIQITVPPIQHQFKISQVISPHSVVQLGMNNAEDKTAAGAAAASRDTMVDKPASPPSTSHDVDEPPVIPGTAFKRLSSNYLYPLNLDTNLTKQHLNRLMRRSESQAGQAGQQGQGPGRGLAAHRRGGDAGNQSMSLTHETSLLRVTADSASNWDEEMMAAELTEELLQDLVMTPEVVLTILSQLEGALVDWYKAQAPEALKDRLSKEEFTETLTLLSDDPTIKFFITAINFLHEEFVRGCPSYPHNMESKVNAAGAMRAAGSMHRKSTMLTHARSARHAVAPNNTLSKPQALQKYDIGYQIFVQDRVELLSRQRSGAGADGAGVAARRSLGGAPGSASPSLPSSPLTLSPSRRTGSLPFGALQLPGAEAAAGGSLSGGGRAEPLSPYGDTGGGSPGVRGSRVSFVVTHNTHDAKQQPTESPAAGRPSAIRFAHGQGLPPAYGSSSSSPEPASPGSVPALDHPGLAQTSTTVRRSLRHLTSIHALSAASTARLIMDSLGPADYDALQQSRLYMLQKEFAALYKEKRQHRAGMFFVMPVYLLALRLVVSLLFTSLYPVWTKSNEGLLAVEQMDQTLVQLFDPHGYLQRNLSLLQSTPEAVCIMTKYPHKGHEAERVHFADTSPLLRAALPQPQSAGARRLMAQAAATAGRSASAPIRTQLTLAQREALYADVQEAVLNSRDANLAQIGEPVVTSKRDSWIPRPDKVR